jgi:hypothetical protein
LAIKRQKFLQDLKHVDHLRQAGLSNLEIADRLTHAMIEMLRAGMRARFPDANSEEITRKMREAVDLDRAMKRKRHLNLV